METENEKEIIRFDSDCFDDVSVCVNGDERSGVTLTDFWEGDPGGKAVGGPGTDSRASDEPLG
jgi:hypothetical protein